jgi:hypothetical protein
MGVTICRQDYQLDQSVFNVVRATLNGLQAMVRRPILRQARQFGGRNPG